MKKVLQYLRICTRFQLKVVLLEKMFEKTIVARSDTCAKYARDWHCYGGFIVPLADDFSASGSWRVALWPLAVVW